MYLALLRIGQAGSGAIAREARLHGQLVYRALERLGELSLVDKTTINRRARFAARPPERLLERLDATRDELAQAVSTLATLHTPRLQDQIIVSQGRQQFVERELAQVRATPKGSEILIISGVDDGYWDAMGSAMHQHTYERVTRNIRVRYVGSEPQRGQLRSMDLELFSARLLPHAFTGSVNIAIFPDAFGTYLFTEPPTSMYLTNTNVAESYRSFFEALWKMGK